MSVREIVNQIRNLDENEVENWIQERIEYLEEHAEFTEDDVISTTASILRRNDNTRENTEIHGYIPSKTRIKKYAHDFASFRVDDINVYKMLVDSIRKSTSKFNNDLLIRMIQATVINYFASKGNETRRDALYDSRDMFDEEPLSISDFRRNGTAMCIERSALAQNLLAFIDFDPMLIFGYLSSDKGITNEHHAYSCIIWGNVAKLIDFTNPIEKDGIPYLPASFNLGPEDLEKFKKGEGQVEVKHRDYYTKDGRVEGETTSLVYASDEIDPKYFDRRKDTQELGSETITEQKDTDYIDETEKEIEAEERAIESTKDNAQSL